MKYDQIRCHKPSRLLTLISFTLALPLLLNPSSHALELSNLETVCDTDYAVGGASGLMHTGAGKITLTPLHGAGPLSVATKAYLYWHGQINPPDGSSTPSTTALAQGSLNGTSISATAVHIGFSGKNGWEPRFKFSQAMRADVTDIVNAAIANGNGLGPYDISNFKTNTSGLSLVVFYQDDDNAKNRDLLLFEGNDSNEQNSYDAAGWNAGFTLNYLGGNAFLQLHVSDGQEFGTDFSAPFLEYPLLLNGNQFVPDVSGDPAPPASGAPVSYLDGHSIYVTETDNYSYFEPNFLPEGTTLLWEIKHYPLDKHLTPNQINSLLMTTGIWDDLFSLVLAVVDLPAGTTTDCGAPPPNSPPLINCSSSLTVEANSDTGVASTTLTAHVSDPDGDSLIVTWKVNGTVEETQTLPAGSTDWQIATFTRTFFPGQNNDVAITVTDGVAAPATCTTTVTVLEPVPPVVDCGTSITLHANERGVAPLPDIHSLTNYPGNNPTPEQVVLSDNHTPSPDLTIDQLPLPGALISVGTHEVTVVVRDEALNSALCTKTFIVEPNPESQPPTIDCGTPPDDALTIQTSATGWVEIPNMSDHVTVSDDLTPLENLLITQDLAVGTLVSPGTYLITVTVTDEALLSDSCVKTLVVEGVLPPTAVDDSASTPVDTPLHLPFSTLLQNDLVHPDIGGGLLLISAQDPANGTVLLNNSTGEVVFQPTPGFTGTASFTYTIESDVNQAQHTATVTVTVIPDDPNPIGNLPPVALDDFATTTLQPMDVFVLENDSDPEGDALSIVDLSTTDSLLGTIEVIGGDYLLYTPKGLSGVDTFTYTIFDGVNTAAATVTVTIEVEVEVDPTAPPLAVDDIAVTSVNTPVTIPVLNNDSDPDQDPLTVISHSAPANGAATLNQDGTITYQPGSDFTGVDHFTYTISDGRGGTSTATVFVSVGTSDGCDLYPIALHISNVAGRLPGDSITDVYNGVQPGNFGWLTWAGSPNEPTLVTSLTPPGDSHTYINPFQPADHQVSTGDWVQGSPGVSNSRDVRDALDILKTINILLPVWDVSESNGKNAIHHVVGFAKVRLTDYHLPKENRITATFLAFSETVDGLCFNSPPIAAHLSVETQPNTAIFFHVAPFAHDFEDNLDPDSAHILNQPAHGAAIENTDGTFTYVPAPGFSGTDHFTYQIHDQQGLASNVATVTVSVSPVSSNP